MRVDADEKAAAAAVEVDQRQIEDARFEIDWQSLLRAEGAGAADQIAGLPVRDLGLARLDALAANLSRQFQRCSCRSRL